MFLDHLKTNGNKTTFDASIEIKAVSILVLKIRYEITKAATPSATFNP
jgi:hypothetical protein